MSRPPEVEERLRELFDERAQLLQSQVDTHGQLRALVRRFPRERRRSMATLVTAAAAALAVIAGVSYLGADLATRAGRTLPPSGPPLPAPAPTIATRPLPTGALRATVKHEFVTPVPWLAIGNAAWIEDIHDATIIRVDIRNLRVLSIVSYGGVQAAYTGPLVRAGNIVLFPVDSTPLGGSARILRFNATTGRALAPVKIDHAGAVTATDNGVFAVIGVGRIGAIDAQHGRVMRSFAVPVGRELTYAAGLLWGWDHRGAGALVGVDASRGVVVRRYPLPRFSAVPLVAVGADRLLLASPDGVALLDPRTGEITARTHFTAANWAPDGHGLLWGVVTSHRLVAVDDHNLAMQRNFAVNDLSLVGVFGGRLFAGDRTAGRVHVGDLSRL